MSEKQRRRQERDWPTLPVPFFGFQIIYEELAAIEWEEKASLPPLIFADRGKIVSALASPFATTAGKEHYPTVPAKAAAMFRGLVKNHGLRDGNKRVAVTTMSTFLLANGWIPAYTNSQLYRYAVRVAKQEGNYPVHSIEMWIRRNARLMSDAELRTVREQNLRFMRADPDLLATAFDVSVRPARR